jgi:enoyl-CoA hydratase/carnithine racemase
MNDDVHLESAGKVRRVTIDRPAKKNALTIAMYERLADALSRAAVDDAIAVVVLAGRGDAFSAGNDMADFVRAAGTGVLPPPIGEFLRVLASFPKPIVAAVNGVAIGIGATMLLHCDYVVASTRAAFQFPFTRLALVPEGASTVLLPARVGAQRASEWLLFGDRIDAESARAAGLVNDLVAPDALDATATAKASALAGMSLGALCETKRLLREPQREAVAQALARELQAVDARLRAPEASASFAAFLSRGKAS